MHNQVNSQTWNKFAALLKEVNDETKTHREHETAKHRLDGFRLAFEHTLNGDYLYEDVDRPMCCGEFLDWKYKGEM
jgi:hypothetical protein